MKVHAIDRSFFALAKYIKLLIACMYFQPNLIFAFKKGEQVSQYFKATNILMYFPELH